MNELTRETIDSRSYAMVFDEEVRNHYKETDEGPFWFRGYHYAKEDRYPQGTSEQVDSILDTYDVSAIVVGHTGVARIESLYEGPRQSW